MKKHSSPTTKECLSRSAFHLLVAVCAIPLVAPLGASASDYVLTTGSRHIVLGTTDIGNHDDDTTTTIALPFSVQFYGQTFSSVIVGSNGTLGFVANGNAFTNVCPLPAAAENYAILPHWDDLQTNAQAGCASYPNGTCGVYTRVEGTAPNRIFDIEWRAVYFSNSSLQANFEVSLFESNSHFEIVYGQVSGGGASATVGVQSDTGSTFTQYECNTGGVTPGLLLTSCERPQCQFRVLIAYADSDGPPTTIRNEIAAEPGVLGVDLFDAASGTPTLAQLQQYDVVYAFSNNPWSDAVTMGDVLADYEDGGGVVVVGGFAWDNRGAWLLEGRWVTDGYSPFDSTSTTNFSTSTASITDPGNPLMQGVVGLSAIYRNGVTLAAAGVSSVADWTDGPPAVAYRTKSGHTASGLNAYLGYPDAFSGDWGRVIVNAARWAHDCGGIFASGFESSSTCAWSNAVP